MSKKNEILGARLKELRGKSGRSQEYVASAIGISRARYSHYENNHVEPDIDLIRRFAVFFNVTTDYLLGSTDVPDKAIENNRDAILHKIAKEFPDIDLMFEDLQGMNADQLKEVYDFIKFKKEQGNS